MFFLINVEGNEKIISIHLIINIWNLVVLIFIQNSITAFLIVLLLN